MASNKSTFQIAADYNTAKSTVKQYKKKCLYTTKQSSKSNKTKETRRLKQLLNEKDKEIAFLKKQRHS